MSLSLAASVEFYSLCEELEKIMNFKSFKRKFDQLSKFFHSLRKLGNKMKSKNKSVDNSLYPFIRLLLPQLERERGPYCLRRKSLTSLYCRILCLRKDSLVPRNQLLKTDVNASEDFPDRLYNATRRLLKIEKSSITIEQINQVLDKLSSKESKYSILFTIVRQLTAFELKWLTRILLKDLKLGIGKSRIFEAFYPNAEKIFNVTSNLRDVSESFEIEKAQIKLFSHFQPMLLERLKIEDIGKLFDDKMQEYFVQVKFDGERSQIHMKNQEFKYFTRNGYDITNNTLYGKCSDSGFLSKNIARLLDKDCHSLIMDGEIMGWHKEKRIYGSKAMPYDVKKLTNNSAHQPCFVAFDLIMFNNQLLINLPYTERLQRLEKLFIEENGILVRAETKKVSSSLEVMEYFNKCLDEKLEGIVIKRCDVIYKPKVREKSGCYKIKAEYSENLIQDIDLLVLGGNFSSGKSIGKLNSFLVGVADSEEAKTFKSVVFVSSGLNYQQIIILEKRFEQHSILKCPVNIVGPRVNTADVWINPENSVILQLRASEIVQSNVYPLGYTLRFPRVVKIKENKSWNDVCTCKEFLSLIKDNNNGGVQKLTKRRANIADSAAASKKVPSRQIATVFPRVQQVYEESSFLDKVRRQKVTRLSRLFEGKEFCILSGDDELLSKNEIEDLLLAHSAQLIKHARGDKTFCVLVGRIDKKKVKNAVESQSYDVVKTSWLKRATRVENWSKLQDWYPWEMLSARPQTRIRLAEIYDEFHDSFINDTKQEDLKRIMDKAQENIKNNDEPPPSVHDMKSIDKELFETESSRFSLFRGIIAYFHNQENKERFKFRFMSGIMCTSLKREEEEEEEKELVTHIFIEESDSESIIKQYIEFVKSSKHHKIHLVNSQWISDCFNDGKLLDICKYEIKFNY